MLELFKKIMFLVVLVSLMGLACNGEIELQKKSSEIDNNNKIQVHKACQLHQFDNNIKNVCFEYNI